MLDLTCDISAVISNILAEGITLELVILYVWSVYDKSVSITVENINKYSYCVDTHVVFCCISTTFDWGTISFLILLDVLASGHMIGSPGSPLRKVTCSCYFSQR